jgi:putative ABC transport system permease protein
MSLPAGFRRLFRLPPSRASLDAALPRVLTEIDSELRFHLESRVRELVESGVTREEAEEQSLREFGDLARARSELTTIDLGRVGREERSELLSSLYQDLRLGLRLLPRNPAFAVVAILTLALGIGANTAIFSGVDAVLLRPLPFQDADRLVGVWLDGKDGSWASGGTLSALRTRSETMELGAWSGWTFVLTGDGEAESIDGARVSTNVFSLLGVRPLLGRTFTELESLPWPGQVYAGGSAAVLSHGLWLRRYGADAGIIGRTIMIDGMAVPVVGVLPADFVFPNHQAEIWLPVAINPTEAPTGGGYLRLIGRLREGRTMQSALLEVHALIEQLRREHPDRFREPFGQQASVYPLRDDLVGATKRTLLVLFGAVGFVLLIACANVANLFFARATVRAREMSIRTALGAGRGRLLRQALTEQLTLAGCGAALGLGVAYWGSGFLARALPQDLTRGGDIEVNGRVLVFTVALTILTALLSGLAPALRASSGGASGMAEGSQRTGAGRERRRLLESLVVIELAVAVVLVVGATLMLQSFWRLTREDPGFRTEGVLTFRAAPPDALYPLPAQRAQLTGAILERLEALPGVLSVGAIHLLPLGGGNWGDQIAVEGRAVDPGQTPPRVSWRVVTTDYFRTAGIPLLAGRAFTDEDRTGAPAVAVANQTLAREIFPGEDPIGKRVRTGFEGSGWATVVGVVGDTRDMQLRGAPTPQLYRPHEQFALAAMTYLIRTSGDPMALAEAARDIVADVGSNVPVSGIKPLRQVVSASVSQPRLLTMLLAAFGAIALLMAALGIYGVIAYAVGQRKREFGIRLALGAHPRDVLRQVVRSGAALALVGLLLGVAGAWVLSGFLGESLYQVEPRDPATFAAVAALLGTVAILGSYIPARRAARVDPATSLSNG